MAFSLDRQEEITHLDEDFEEKSQDMLVATKEGYEKTNDFVTKSRDVRNFIKSIVDLGDACSDVHICTGHVPIARINGELQAMESIHPFTEPEIQNLCEFLAPKKSIHDYITLGHMDLSSSFRYGLESEREIRLRINLFKDRGGASLALRIIRDTIPTMQELRLPPSIRNLRHLPYGLVVICGPTGSGKSTTLAAMIEAINEEEAKRIITIEDPVEYIHSWKKSVISQREVGTDCLDFSDGLRSALRQDPDVILVGEMRDAQTIATALAAAETGHLVFSTLHTGTAVEAIDRMVQYFPAEAHSQIKNEIASCFRAFVAQKLFKTNKGNRVAAFEVLLHNEATASLIRQGMAYQLPSYMLSAHGMIRMEDSIKGLRNLQLID